jgi:tight adherence protein D
MAFFKKITALCLCTFVLVGCASNVSSNGPEAHYQEDILLKAKNYSGLISLYRSRLQNNEDPHTRQKLAHYYYMAGDYNSSLYYLQPLLAQPTLQVFETETRDLIALGKYQDAKVTAAKMIDMAPDNAVAYNLQGIAQSLSGELVQGKQSIQYARTLFLADDIAVNNMAMVAILQQHYQEAVSLLMPQYVRGTTQPELVRNLVLSLVKLGDRQNARAIIANEKLSQRPDELIEALYQLTPEAKDLS